MPVPGPINVQDEWNMISQQDLHTEDSQETHGRSASTLNLDASRIPSTTLMKIKPQDADSTTVPSSLQVKKTVIQSR